jgi:hypothetical protein
MLQVTCIVIIRKNHTFLEHNHDFLMCQGDPIGTPTTTFAVLPALLCLCALGVGMCRQQIIDVIHMNKMLDK